MHNIWCIECTIYVCSQPHLRGVQHPHHHSQQPTGSSPSCLRLSQACVCACACAFPTGVTTASSPLGASPAGVNLHKSSRLCLSPHPAIASLRRRQVTYSHTVTHTVISSHTHTHTRTHTHAHMQAAATRSTRCQPSHQGVAHHPAVQGHHGRGQGAAGAAQLHLSHPNPLAA